MADKDGGYDAGYSKVPCLWGSNPGSLVKALLKRVSVEGMRVLDIGAGEGKNAAALADHGAHVDAVECSRHAIANGQRAFPTAPINWILGDAADFVFRPRRYDVVVSYGLLHCMPTFSVAERVLRASMEAVKPGGRYIHVSFNSGPHDMSAHPGFEPLLLAHEWYLNVFREWTLEAATDELLYESHAHNGIPHFHSMSRIIARRT